MSQHENHETAQPHDVEQCNECPVAAASRRAFLRAVGLGVVGALGVSAASSRAAALVRSVVTATPTRSHGLERSYAVPSTDSVSIDAGNDVIIARWENRVYAFSLRCPHRGTRLEWRASESRVFCPKHKARFRPDGSHDSGRGSRDLDRYEIRREGGSLVVNLDMLHHVDEEPEAWRAAAIVLA